MPRRQSISRRHKGIGQGRHQHGPRTGTILIFSSTHYVPEASLGPGIVEMETDNPTSLQTGGGGSR